MHANIERRQYIIVPPSSFTEKRFFFFSQVDYTATAVTDQLSRQNTRKKI